MGTPTAITGDRLNDVDTFYPTTLETLLIRVLFRSYNFCMLGKFLLVVPEPNGKPCSIQHAWKVQEYPSTEVLTVVVMYEQVVKKSWRNFDNRKIGNAFACVATTKAQSQTEATIGFSASERSKNSLLEGSDCGWRCVNRWWKLNYVVS